MHINRRLEKEIGLFLGRKEVIAIISPRQAGMRNSIALMRSATSVSKASAIIFLASSLANSSKVIFFSFGNSWPLVVNV